MNSHRLFTILLSFLLAIPAATAYGHDIPIEFQPESRPPEGSLTEIMQDMLLTSLSPVITGAIHDYYEDERLQWAPYDVRLLQAKRLKGYDRSIFASSSKSNRISGRIMRSASTG